LLFFKISAAELKKYPINYNKSYIEFSTKHVGNEFSGKFNKFNAEINFDFTNVENSNIYIKFQLKSATTGDQMRDKTLPTKDWFDAENFPNAEFTSSKITKDGDLYQIDGNLKIKNTTKNISFKANINKNKNLVQAKGEFKIDRLKFNIGKKSDPEAKWVDQYVKIKFKIENGQ
jgi:polyisoprenoid-binding protein YceI